MLHILHAIVLLPMDHQSVILLHQKKELHQHPTGMKIKIPFMMV